MAQYDDFDDDFISKTQLKREAEQQQALGLALINLNKAELTKIPLDEDLADAIELAQKIRNKHEAFRRQVQYIGKLMRARDPEPIEAALDLIRNKHNAQNAHFHKLEQLRDQLVNGDNEDLRAALQAHPQLGEEIQRLRQLVRQAKKEVSQSKPPKSSRELFKLLREQLEE
ncbi:ribosome biogenesis factor YjgA [Ferrimonas gelatinilytica]|uniref:Dual-action ribosomal maturation protein DarP n=1 Tax=Ferrimonas gelatinilytica TaxID=1255257 RepID=A0ABP9SF93_9GAMM